MLEISPKSNLLEQKSYRYSLQDVAEPNLYREVYNYEEVPKVPFNHRRVPLGMPADIWITDTTFRDGMQSQAPYSPKQIVDIYKMLSRLGGPKGLIRSTEFFVYSENDRKALNACRELGLEFPQITTWIRATENDFKLVRDLGIKETGILVSCSDYHIFKKLGMTRSQALEHYLEIISEALELGICPRCHFEDITRADFYGFVVPFVNEIQRLSQESGIPIRIRACDTMGYGEPYSEVALPRSVPGIIYGLQHYSDVPSEMLEWHGHNDFHKAVANATCAWLYGASAVNASMLGIGERTGNVPLEAMVFEYASLRGTLDGMDPTVITEIAEYFQKEIGYDIPPMTPFVGENFNVTRAGIHADGMIKDEEIYNIFDTQKLLGRPAGVTVSSTSGLAGIAYWINCHYRLTGAEAVTKKDPMVAYIKEWVDAQYVEGRQTVISSKELEQLIIRYRKGK
ncbi:MAG TPA: 2-isopropylmalate synthase [Clostridiales bacterium]|nr:2-isopropylmalate synthase [Clostridiales bacterium]